MLYDGSPRRLDRARELSRVTPLELRVPSKEIAEISFAEIVDPLLDERVRVMAVKIVGSLTPVLGENFEMALMIADELDAGCVVLPVDAYSADLVLECLNELFRLGATYSKYVVLEPARGVMARVISGMREHLGGVFKLSISPSPNSTTEEVLALSLAYLGQLKLVKLANFNSRGDAVRVSSVDGMINSFRLVKELVRHGYDNDFVLDYESFGLTLPTQLVRDDYELLEQYLHSLLEKLP